MSINTSLHLLVLLQYKTSSETLYNRPFSQNLKQPVYDAQRLQTFSLINATKLSTSIYFQKHISSTIYCNLSFVLSSRLIFFNEGFFFIKSCSSCKNPIFNAIFCNLHILTNFAQGNLQQFSSSCNCTTYTLCLTLQLVQVHKPQRISMHQ